MKRWMRVLAAAFLLALFNTALAETGTLSVRLHAGDANVPHAILEIYRIGDMKIENANRAFELSAAFSGSGETLSSPSDKALPGRLAEYAQANGLSALETIETDASGIARFGALEEGAYLVCQAGFSQSSNYTQIEPFIMTVPMSVDGKWVYQVEAAPKIEPIPTASPTPAPTKPPEDSNLPQTGLPRWPVSALGALGLALFALGGDMCFVMRRKKG